MSGGLLGRWREALVRRVGGLWLRMPGGPSRLQRTVDHAYLEWAARYDQDARVNLAIRLEEPFLDELVAAEPHHRLLDVGCGTGLHLKRLAPSTAMAVGCDRSLAMLRAASTAAPDQTPVLVAADALRAWPFPDASFHRVLSTLLLSHLPALGPFYREAARVLRPGGLLVTDAFFWDVEGFEPVQPDLLTRWRRRGRPTFVAHTPLDHVRAANRAGLPLERVNPLVIGETVASTLEPRSYRRNRGRCVAFLLRWRKPEA